MKASDRTKLAAATSIAAVAWTFVLLVVSVPLAIALLLIMAGLVVRRHRRASRAHGVQ